MTWINRIDTALDRLLVPGRWLVLPVGLLLFAQWPLRELLGAYTREANDLAQALFALYVAMAVTAATRDRCHLTAASLAARLSPSLRRKIARAASLLMVAPWAGFVLVTGWPAAWQSIRHLEAFPETYNSGYFVIKAAAALLVLLVLIQALLDAVKE